MISAPGMGKSTSVALGLAVFAHASDVFAQASPAPGSPAPAAAKADQSQDIVVVAPAEERSSIDRTTYVVRDTPESRSASTLDLLTHVPFVEVTSSGQVRLLGTSGVTILIDGKKVADPATMLRNLQGSQIAKIEVITNPSAQFSAQGTGGIINIITRRTAAPGVGGSVTASGDSFGGVELKASPTWARGRLSLSGSLDLNHGGTATNRNDDERYRIGPGGALVPDVITRAVNRYDGDGGSGNLVISYKPTARQTISLTGFAVGGHTRSSGTADIDFGSAPAASFRQTSHGTKPVQSRGHHRRLPARRLPGRRDSDRLGQILRLRLAERRQLPDWRWGGGGERVRIALGCASFGADVQARFRLALR
jgi:outer membrane receptor for ferrienterochelin and colicins